MSIWKQDISIELLTTLSDDTMVSLLGIEFLEVGSDFVRARMPVDVRTRQPYGLMHGGASCVLAETVASMAGHFCLETNQLYCVGVEISTSHIKAVKSGWVIATAKPLHLGQTTQVWEVPIVNEGQQLVSMTRFRLAVLKAASEASFISHDGLKRRLLT